MLCPRCDGKGQVLVSKVILEEIYKGHGDIDLIEDPIEVLEPCPECYGHRVVHCCEGLMENDGS